MLIRPTTNVPEDCNRRDRHSAPLARVPIFPPDRYAGLGRMLLVENGHVDRLRKGSPGGVQRYGKIFQTRFLEMESGFLEYVSRVN